MAEILTIEEIEERKRQIEQERQAPPRRWIRQLGDAVDDYVHRITNPAGRWMFGIDRLDLMVRGIGRGDLGYFIGRAHSGKTQLLLNTVRLNPTGRVLWISPDEAASLVLIKLVAMTHGIMPEALEYGVKHSDPEVLKLLHTTATETYPNLLIVDRSPSVDGMKVALEEARDHWQADPHLVVFDFLELLVSQNNDAVGVSGASKRLKAFGIEENVPLAVVHQSSRSGGDRGEAAGMDGMRYGGETEATVVVEVYRRAQSTKLSDEERNEVINTITANVAKNKNPPSKTGEVELFLQPSYGYIREIRDGDVGTPRQYFTGGNVDASTPPPIPSHAERQAEILASLRQEQLDV